MSSVRLTPIVFVVAVAIGAGACSGSHAGYGHARRDEHRGTR